MSRLGAGDAKCKGGRGVTSPRKPTGKGDWVTLQLVRTEGRVESEAPDHPLSHEKPDV